MKFGVVVHGPNIIDSGYAKKIINLLSNWGEVKCRLGGTMGRTAVIDASLEDIIDISKKLLPSESLTLFNREDIDVIFLLNYGKSSTTGHVFGYKVVNHYFDNVNDSETPLIQIERPGEDDGSIIIWKNDEDSLNLFNEDVDDLANDLAKFFKLNIVSPNEIYKKHFQTEDLKGNQRIIHGVSPNENILVNGIVIGKSTSDKVILVTKNGIITDIIGGTIKKHGVEKLGPIDLSKAVVKTGLLRKSDVKPRILSKKNNKDILKIAFLDHAAEDVYKYKDIDLIVTIGDDTTLIASDILYRFNIPIIGITDGDLDKVVEKGFKAKGSLIFLLEEGYDDLVGEEIFNKIFKRKNILSYSLKDTKFYNKETFIEDKIKKVKFNIIEIIKNMNCRYDLTII